MWVKYVLIIMPLVLVVFLVQSMFWAPTNDDIANAASRQNRLIFYMGGNPENMNPWLSTATTDSTISDYFFDGVLRYNKMYEIEPYLANTVVVKHEAVMMVPTGYDRESFEALIRAEYKGKVSAIKKEETKKFELPKEPKALKPLQEGFGDELLKSLAERMTKAEWIRVTLSAKPKAGQIVTAVEPEIIADLGKRAGKTLYPEFDWKAIAAKNATEKKPAKQLLASYEQLASQAGFVSDKHFPVVDCELHKGIHWTDGPFFGDEKKSEYSETFGPKDDEYWWGKGPELTARDIKLTYELLKDPLFASPRRSSYLAIIETRTFKENKYRFQVVFNELYSPALGELTGNILPYHIWNDEAWTAEAERRELGPKDVNQDADVYNPRQQLRAKTRDFSLKPSFLGRMVMEPLNGDKLPLWRNNLQIRLRRNEFFWDRKPEYQFIDYYVFDPKLGSETSEMVFQTGGIDVYGAKPYQVKRYEKLEDKFYVIKRQPLQYEYLGFNCENEHLKDRKVRMALSMAIDVKSILNKVVFDQGERISGPAYPVLNWYNKEYRIEHTWRTGPKKGQTERLQFLPYDLDEAKALLEEAGYRDSGGQLAKNGKPLKLRLVNATGAGPRQSNALLAMENWKALGVDVDYKEYEWTDYIRRIIMAMDYDVCVLGWSGGLSFDKRQLWHSANKPPSGLNFVGYNSPKADKLMEDILKVYDADEQIRMSHELYNTIANDFPYVFLYSPYATTIVDRHIVWRKQVGTDADGNPKYEDRPLTDKGITDARASWRYFEPELVRRSEIPTFGGDE